MNLKIKILIGALVVGIILISGWWIWNGQTIKNPRGICGPKGMGINYDVLYCDETCNVDDDCKFTCGCGAINKNEICHDEGITYDCVDHEVKCKEGRCIIGKGILLKGVTLTTDKTEYEQGETVEITVRNNLVESIWYREWDTKCSGTSFSIGKKRDNRYSFYPLGLAECAMDEVELKPKATRIYALNLNEWKKTKFPHTDIDTGVYKWRFIYILKNGDKESKTIYSNEFTIKEKITCDWCGRACVSYPVSKEDCEKAGGIFLKQCACPEVAPPEDLICVEENGKCVQKSKSSFGEIYIKGEPVIFSINTKVKVLTNELPFKIVNEKGESIKLKHSCVGFVGCGVDEYCENGKIVRKGVYQLCDFSKKWCYGCSDAIGQREEYVNETFVWDQKEYVEITEECEGKTIHREVKKQVPEGKYQIIVNGEVIKEFVIVPGECEGLSEKDCLANDNCKAIYGPSYCSPKGICTQDWVFKSCVPSSFTSDEPENITKIPCMPRVCYTYYCDKDLEHCDKENAFGILGRPPAPHCIGETIYKIKGETVSEKEFYAKIDEKNKECGNCIIPVPQPCR